MSRDHKHDHTEPDCNAILVRVEKMLKEGTLEELPVVSPTHVNIDPEAVCRIHGKDEPKVHIETCDCQMSTKNTTDAA